MPGAPLALRPVGHIVLRTRDRFRLLALQRGGSKYGWKGARIIALFVFGVLISIFGVQVWKQDRATIPPRILKQRSIWSSAAYAVSIGSASFIPAFYLGYRQPALDPLRRRRLHLRRRAHPADRVLCPIHDRFFHHHGLVSTLKVNSGHTKWIPVEIICGLRIGLGMHQPMLAAHAVYPLSDIRIIMFSVRNTSYVFLFRSSL